MKRKTLRRIETILKKMEQLNLPAYSGAYETLHNAKNAMLDIQRNVKNNVYKKFYK